MDLVCVQETRIQDLSKACVCSLGVSRFHDWNALEAEGATGGILLFWDKRKMDLVEAEIGSFSITCLFKNVEDGFMWAFTGVYGPVERRSQEIFWEELGSLKGLWGGPWCLGGDFNVTLSPNERKRGGRLSPFMGRFAEVVNELGLRDLTLQGDLFTWRGGLNGRLMSRLDRFLVTANWENKFSNAVQSTLSGPMSDHCPILLDIEGIKLGIRPFRFEMMWLKYEGFKDLLRDWWQNMQFSGSFSFVLASKLKALKGILKYGIKRFLVELRPKRRRLLGG